MDSGRSYRFSAKLIDKLTDPQAKYTDDTVMTVAVADALMCTMGDSDEDVRETPD